MLLPLLLISGSAFLISFVFQGWLIRFLRRHNFSLPQGRLPKEPRSRLGGLGIFAGLLGSLYLFLFLFASPHLPVLMEDLPIPRDYLLFIGGLVLIFFLGLVDDLTGLNAKQKLAVELLVAGALFSGGFRVEFLTLPFGRGSFALGWFSLPFTALWLVTVTNAFNLIDGLDGLAGGTTLILSLNLIVLCHFQGAPLYIPILAALFGAVAGFLPFNIYPAKIYMGDGGSLLLGLFFAVLSLKLAQKAVLGISLMVPLVFLAVPLLDTFLSFVRRLLAGKNPLQGDNDHIHHRLMKKGFREPQAVGILLTMTALFSLLSLLLTRTFGVGRFFAVGAALLLATGTVIYLNYLPWKGNHHGKGKNP
ncbi:MAG TPA: MraY family glycosyltransferase [Candidatus Aminicenantes bacterium]|nr:MraY family glycosyltransferase [Candidatus Aminicenantes bacterium]HPS99176.1 MraY family glycosyltransferase [Candidatus Aminicenantes bacterium]